MAPRRRPVAGPSSHRSHHHALLVVLVVAFVVVTPTSGRAQPLLARSPIHAGVDVLADAPRGVGARAWIEAPLRLRLGVTVATMPRAVVKEIAEGLVEGGAFDARTARLVSGGLDHMSSWGVHLGWQPFARRGLYGEAGYGRTDMSGVSSGAEAYRLVTGTALDAADYADAGGNYAVHVQLETIDANLGWRWRPLARPSRSSGLELSAAVGITHILGAQTTVRPRFQPDNWLLEALYVGYAEHALEKAITSQSTLPTLQLAAGYRFF